MVTGHEDKSCAAKSTFGFLSLSKGDPQFFEGTCDGNIAQKPQGDNGFGWDPVFVPLQNNDKKQSFAEMSTEEKNKISHRANALKLFKAYLTEYVADYK